jgi:cobalt-zinc-cadmium efflux system membrane fusion protein
MRPDSDRATILLVDDDEIPRRAIGKALKQSGYAILEAGDAPTATASVDQQAPDLALIDLHLPGPDGVDVARQLHERIPALPVVLMSADAVWLRDHPEIHHSFTHVLTKPIDLTSLQSTVAEALRGKTVTQVNFGQVNGHEHNLIQPPAPAKPEIQHHSRWHKIQSIAVLLIGLAALIGFGAFATGIVSLPARAGKDRVVAAPIPPPAVELVADYTLRIPEDVQLGLSIRSRDGKESIATAHPPEHMPPLTLTGSTAVDPGRYRRVRIRFTPAEVVEIAKILAPTEASGQSVGPSREEREIRVDDKVKRGDLLAVVHSLDVGQKKNDLFEALIQLDLDRKILAEARKSSGVLPLGFMLNAEHNVNQDFSSVVRAENTLYSWEIPDADINAVRQEAKEAGAKVKDDPDRKDETEAMRKARLDRWSRVSLYAPDDGTMIERNVVRGEMIVDNTLNLFQLAQMDRVQVSMNVPEDELPNLHKLTLEQRRWTVHTVGFPAAGFEGPFAEVGLLIDPNQHSAIVRGYVMNPGEQIRGGQYAWATINLRPPDGVVEIPIGALADDGRQTLVFVQSKQDKQLFTMRRVKVTNRYEDVAYVVSADIPEKDQLTNDEKEEGLLPRQPLHEGDRVLTRGALELKAALLDLKADQDKDKDKDSKKK